MNEPRTPPSLIEGWAGTGEHHEDGCLMCAVRALTEGEPREIMFDNPGDEVTGVILKVGRRAAPFADEDWAPYVWLWLGGAKRVRVTGYGVTLKRGLEDAAGAVGDTMTIRFEGPTTISSGRFKGKPYRLFVVTVVRGH